MKNKKKGETDLMSGPSGNDAGGMKKTLSIWNFFTIGFGAIIGTGWVLLVGDWMVIGGGPIAAMIAFAIGAVFLLPIGAVFGELTAAIPISGGQDLRAECLIHNGMVPGSGKRYPLSLGGNRHLYISIRYVRGTVPDSQGGQALYHHGGGRVPVPHRHSAGIRGLCGSP